MTDTASDPRNPDQLRRGLSAADQQSAGDVGQVCATCPDNWVEAGAIDDSNGQPLPGIGYRIYNTATNGMVASGILDDKGKSPRHSIPMPATQLYVVFGTEAALDQAEAQIAETQRRQALEANAVSEWRGMPSGLSREAFDEQALKRASEGDAVFADRGFFGQAARGARGLIRLPGAIGEAVFGDGVEAAVRDFYEPYLDESWEQYQLATGARTATRSESFGAAMPQGATFGFDEEISARLNSLFDKRSYEELVEAQRQVIRQNQISNPGTFTAGEIVGSVPTIFVPVGGAAANAARAGRGVSGAIRAGGTTGAKVGALSGAGHDEGGVLDRLDGTALGAATGGLAGAVLGGAGVIIARGVSRTRIWGRVAGQRSVSDRLDDLYKTAPKSKEEIDALAQDIAERHGGKVATAPLKGKERALEKVINEYGGDTSRLSDVARNTIVVDKSQISSVVRELEARGATVKVVDAASNPLGYSGVLSKIRTSNGMMAEIQVNTPGMIFAKEPASIARSILGEDTYGAMVRSYGDIGGRGHVFYEQVRSGGLSARELSNIEQQSRAYYDIFNGGR